MKAPLPTAFFAALAILLQAASGSAQAQPNPIVLKSIAETEVEVKNEQGEISKQRVPLSKAPPGAEVIYTTTFENRGTKPAADIVVTNPVPENTVYVSGSASGEGTVVTFSVDGGKTYGTPDKLTITTPDGRTRPAAPADYSDIRWVYTGELPPGKTGKAEFRVVVK